MFVWVVPILLMLSESVQCLVHSSWGKPESKHVIIWKPLMGLQAHSREIQLLQNVSDWSKLTSA